jgi:RNA polymerase-binding protein DksA
VANQLKHIQAHLKSERKRLNEELKLKVIPSAAERHEGSPFGKREETATECSELWKRLALLQRTREQFAEVECALGKLGKGTYGLCDSCGKSIPLARLEAMPQANLCLDCKARHAKNSKDRSPGREVA